MTVEVDVEALPLLLCGPILRRVSPTSVSVFVVLKAHRWVQLKLYDHSSTFTPNHDFVDEPIGGIDFEVHDTVRLGRNFFVGMATLTLTGSERLTPGHQYWYNVFLHETADGSGDFVSLAQSEFHLLTTDNPSRIGFAPEHLPGFVVAPTDQTKLNIVQGSCRKPHGEGLDMLAALDAQLAIAGVPVPLAKRPHLLILGGDQIYADDVSPPLLKLVHDRAKALLGWDETLSGTDPHATAEETLTDGLKELRAAVDAWRADPIPLTDFSNDSIDEIAELLTEVIDHVEWSDDWAKNKLAKAGLRLALWRYEQRARKWVDETEPSIDPGIVKQTGLAVMNELTHGVASWFGTFEALFEPLSTSQSWGRVALLQHDDDEAPLLALRHRLALAEGSPASGPALYTALVAVFDTTFVGEDLGAWLTDMKAMVSALDALQSDTDVIRGFIGALRAEWFFNDLDPIDDPDDLDDDPDPGALDAFDFVPSRISPPQRGFELKEHAKLTSDAMDSHLMFIGEFYLMYTMVWSDVMWPTIGTYAARSFAMPLHFEAVPNYGLTGPLGPSGLRKANDTLKEFADGLPRVRRVLANIPTLMMFDDHEVTDDWNLNEDWVSEVNGKLAGTQVLRNAMAAYAVFQDWGNQPDDYADVAGANRPKGRQILDEIEYVAPTDPSAAPVSPKMFFDDEDADLTSSSAKVNWIFGLGIEALTDMPGITEHSVVTLDEQEVAYRFVDPTDRKRWDWSFDIELPPNAPAEHRSIHIISLDTRTHRGFPDELWSVRVGIELDTKVEVRGKIAAAALINGVELTTQLSDRLDTDALHLIVSPAPVFGLPLIEDLLQRYQVLTAGPEVADFESWQANPHGFGQLLTTLRSADCVLLSGDVHYAYSNLMSFPPDDPADGVVEPPKLLLQLCSSSMKNETALTQILGAVGRSGRLADFIGPALAEIGQMVVNTFANLGETLGDLGSDLKNFGTWWDETAPFFDITDPAAWATYYLKLKDSMLFSLEVPNPRGLVAVGEAMVAYIVGDLFGAESGVAVREGFTINFLKDIRSFEERLTRAGQLGPRTSTDISDGLGDDTAQLIGEMSEVVGYNNAGLITFNGRGTQATDVVHELLWHPHESDNKPIHEELVFSTVHGDRPPSALLGERIAEIAREEAARWQPPSGEVKESQAAGLDMLRRYRDTLQAYDPVLFPLTGAKFEWLTFDETAQDHWSAMFISYVMHRAQVGEMWFHSPRHIDYVRAAHANLIEDNTSPFRLYHRTQDEAVIGVGDVLGGKKRSNPPVNPPVDMSELEVFAPVLDGGSVPTHFDIVVAVHAADEHLDHRHVHAIGGNVSSSEPDAPPNLGVTSKTKTIRIEEDGKPRSTTPWLIKVEER